jgi:hypothetical protein
MHNTEMHVLFSAPQKLILEVQHMVENFRIVGLLPFIAQVFLNTSPLYVIVLAEAQIALLHLRW